MYALVVHDKTVFLFKRCIIFHFMYRPHFLNRFIHCWTFRLFHIMAVVSNAVMDISMQIHLQDSAFNFFGYIPSSRIAGSQDNSIFSFLRNFHIVFQVTVPFYTPTHSAKGLQFLHIIFNICYFIIFFWTVTY